MAIGARALRAGQAVIELGLLVKPIEKQLKNLQSRLNQMGRSFVRVGSGGMFGGGVGGGFAAMRNLFVGGTAAAAAAWPIKLAANLEMAAAQLGTFTSSEGAALGILKELQKFGAVAMVPFDQLAGAAGMLLRFGVAEEQVALHTKGLAVLAAGNADEFDKLALAFAQVASAGKLQGEEMRQFKNTAFNPLREIAERTGESMDQVSMRMEAGKISFQEVANAMQAAVGPGGRFHHLIERISNTFSGQWSKAISQVKLGLIPIGDQFLGTLTGMLKAVNGVLPVILENINTFISQLITNFQTLHPRITQVFAGIANSLMAGNIPQAATVMWLALEVTWLEGTEDLRNVWIAFKNDILGLIITMGAEMEEQWVKAMSKLKTTASNKFVDIVMFLQGIGKSEAEKSRLGMVGGFLKSAFGGQFASDRDKSLAEIESSKNLGLSAVRKNETEELEAARKELEMARRALNGATTAAEKEAKSVQETFDFGLGKQFADLALAGIDKTKDTFKQPEAFFDTRLARQALSGPQEDQLKELRKIERNTRNLGGGLPVV